MISYNYPKSIIINNFQTITSVFDVLKHLGDLYGLSKGVLPQKLHLTKFEKHNKNKVQKELIEIHSNLC